MQLLAAIYVEAEAEVIPARCVQEHPGQPCPGHDNPEPEEGTK